MTEVSQIPPVGRFEVQPLAEVEYRRFEALLRRLDGADWSAPTDCPAWSVREMAAHVLGATEAHVHSVEMLRQLRRGRRGLAIEVDRVNAAQVHERRAVGPPELIARFSAAAQPAAHRRHLLARWLSRVPLRVGAPIHETWSMRYLMGVIYTRDTWMHRVDVCNAVGATLVLTPEHDGRIIAGIVREWAQRHARPFRMMLAGPAGGTFTASGSAGQALPDAVPVIDLDAVEFARIVSGRAQAPGLLRTRVPF